MANNIEWAEAGLARPVPTEELADLTDAYTPGEVGMAFGDGVMLYSPSWAALADGLERAAHVARRKARGDSPEDYDRWLLTTPCHYCHALPIDGSVPCPGTGDGKHHREPVTTASELDTWSSASRQHYIDTGEYLPADRKGQDQ